LSGIVDGNLSLAGKQMGKWTVRPPASIHETSDIPVLVSSFRSQNTIATFMKKTFTNPLVLTYR
jgi:hypothetical protein